MREHGTTSAYYIIRVMAAMFVVVYLLLFIIKRDDHISRKEVYLRFPCMHLYCVQPRFDFTYLGTFAKKIG